MNKPLGIIFDFGSTILKQISFNPLEGDKEILKYSLNPNNIPAEEIQKYADELNKEIDIITNESMIEFNCQCFHRFLFDIFEIKINLSPLELEQIFWNTSAVFKPTEGIYDLIKVLDNYKIKKGIISNCAFTEQVLRNELRKHNLSDKFDFIISSADYGYRKPSKRIFEIGINKIKCNKKFIWFVGDRIEDDIIGAINSNLHAIWYNPDKKAADKNLEYVEIKSWTELIEKIEYYYNKSTN